MRNLVSLVCAVVLFVPWTDSLHAQFQDPTPAELHMTSDPAAPGASAVYFYLEEKTDDAVHFHSYYARIKVLTEKGKELATVHVPYERGPFQVAAVEGRTIHSDGSIVAFRGKPSDLLAFKGGGHQYNEMTFTLPAVEVGSVIEYRLQIRYKEDKVSSPVWMIQQRYFVHRAHYFFNPVFNVGQDVVDEHGQIAGGLMYATRVPYGGQVVEDSMHRYTLDVADVPPLPSGDYLPPLNTVRESVIFYYTNANSGPEYWKTEGKFWARNVERFCSPSGAIKKAAADLVAPGESNEAKARKIYAAVMKIDNTDFDGSHDPKTKGNKDAGSVLKQQRGSSADIALLYVSLARAAGLEAWPMQVVNRDHAEFEPTYLSMDQFDDYIVVIQINGKDVYIDPGQKMCSFGVLHWKHELTKGFRLSSDGASIEETPAGPPKAAVIRRIADITLDEMAAVTGPGRFVLGGQEALNWRQLALLETKDELAKNFNDYLSGSLPEGVKGELTGFDGLDDYESDLTAHIMISGSLGALTAKRVILPAFLFEARGKHPFLEDDTREVPVDLHYATMEQDEVTYHLSPTMKITSMPHGDSVEWASRIGFTFGLKEHDGAIVATRSFIRTSAVLDSSLYSTLRYVYQKISAADQQQIVLDRAGQTASN
jgi:hypothetical protein